MDTNPDNFFLGKDTMNIKELRKAIRKAKVVFAFVVVTQDDGIYTQVVKSNLLANLKCNDMDIKYFAKIHADETDALYLN